MRSGRMEEHIEVLQAKIKHIEKGLLLGGRRVKTARSHRKKSQITVEHEYSRLLRCRLLGNLAWVYLQQNKYTLAKELYRVVVQGEGPGPRYGHVRVLISDGLQKCKTEFKEGRRLLNRCDKLLRNIAEMNATESQPSPVSVLDSSFYKDDSCSPSPVMKRNIIFSDMEIFSKLTFLAALVLC